MSTHQGKSQLDVEDLEVLLSEDPARCLARESSSFDALSNPASDAIVLFGAGRLGRRILHALRAVGREPVAIADNAAALWGSAIDGTPVLSPQDAAERYGKTATFVVTIWRAGGTHRFEQSRRQLQDLGCSHVVSVVVLAWKYPGEMLPHYCLDLPHKVLADADAVRSAFALMGDARSRHEFVAQLRFRLLGDLDVLPHPDQEPQYLASGLFTVADTDVFVDVGAFDGDTLRTVVETRRPFRSYVAMEPDPENFRALERFAASLPLEIRERIRLMRVAAFSERTRMRVEGSGSASATLVLATGAPQPNDVECVPIDELLASGPMSFFKLDIEGAEPNAIIGAKGTIVRDRPIIAMCVYHLQHHLWDLPLLVNSLVGDYSYFLRPYNEEGWDLVCYAVPSSRAFDGRTTP